MQKRVVQEILTKVRAGGAAELAVETDRGTFFRAFRPKERLILLGGGHISQALCHFAGELGFAVTVVDDRPEFADKARFPLAEETVCAPFPLAIRRLAIRPYDFVAVVTRGHKSDGDCLRQLLADGDLPRYLGMIGSRRRVAGLMRLLEQEGFSPEELSRVEAPIGLPIGALTVDEIAISILAQLIEYRRKGGPRQGDGDRLIEESPSLPALELLAGEGRKCLLLVCGTKGSTPVKSGVMMAVDEEGRTAGTIGGGCAEHAVLDDALLMVGTGESRMVDIDMTNDVAAGEGMVCGGTMQVWLTDVAGGPEQGGEA